LQRRVSFREQRERGQLAAAGRSARAARARLQSAADTDRRVQAVARAQATSRANVQCRVGRREVSRIRAAFLARLARAPHPGDSREQSAGVAGRAALRARQPPDPQSHRESYSRRRGHRLEGA